MRKCFFILAGIILVVQSGWYPLSDFIIHTINYSNFIHHLSEERRSACVTIIREVNSKPDKGRKEIELNHEYFDVISFVSKGDYIYYTCLHDVAESGQKQELESRFAGQQPESQNQLPSGSLVCFHPIEFIRASDIHLNIPPEQPFLTPSDILAPSPGTIAPPVTQPPRVMV